MIIEYTITYERKFIPDAIETHLSSVHLNCDDGHSDMFIVV